MCALRLLQYQAIHKIIFVCGNPTDWAKNLPTQIFFLTPSKIADLPTLNYEIPESNFFS